MKAMKAYLLRYKTNALDSQLIEFEFGRQPSRWSRYRTRDLAEADCQNLNRFGVHVGVHSCSFAVHELPSYFGIICTCHPMPHPGPATAVLPKIAQFERRESPGTETAPSVARFDLFPRDAGYKIQFSAGEQQFFQEKGFTHEPKHCRECKAKRAGGKAMRRIETHVNCAECGIDTTVPFEPTTGKPILCRGRTQKTLNIRPFPITRKMGLESSDLGLQIWSKDASRSHPLRSRCEVSGRILSTSMRGTQSAEMIAEPDIFSHSVEKWAPQLSAIPHGSNGRREFKSDLRLRSCLLAGESVQDIEPDA